MVKKEHEWIIEELKVLRDKKLIARPRVRSNKGYANFPIKWSVEGNFKDYGFKENGVMFRAFASYGLGNDVGGIVFIDMETRKKSHDNQLDKTLNDPKYVTYRKAMTERYAKELIDLCCNVFVKENVDKASKIQLMDYYNKFRDIYTRFELYNNLWFIISDDLAKIIIDRMKDFGCVNPEEIQSLMTPTFQSFINKESIDLISAAIAIVNDPAALELLKDDDFTGLMDTVHGDAIRSMVKKYHWIPFGHAGPDVYDERHYFSEIKKQVMDNQNLDEELSRTKNFYKGIMQKQSAIIHKYGVDDDTVRLISDLHILAQLQDERKEVISRTHFNWINHLMRRIGEFFKLTGRQAADLYPSVIEDCLLHDVVDLTEYKKDEENLRSFRTIEPEGYTAYFDDDAEPFLSIIESEEVSDELRGDSACGGVVIGKVKVLKNSDEISKVDKGDILVTTMTTPDFVPAMRKAAAIITDEGGITCHAAIVSREFGIPCIINTKSATRLLKDGEMVEVDANTGIIKRI
jgi:phosphohistidine swiveling domain-containing protein